MSVTQLLRASRAPEVDGQPDLVPASVRGNSLEAETIKQEVITKRGVFLQRKT